MKLEMTIQFDEEKMREIIEEAVVKLKAEGYLYRDPLKVLPDTPSPYLSEPDPSKYIAIDDTLIPRGK